MSLDIPLNTETTPNILVTVDINILLGFIGIVLPKIEF